MRPLEFLCNPPTPLSPSTARPASRSSSPINRSLPINGCSMALPPGPPPQNPYSIFPTPAWPTMAKLIAASRPMFPGPLPAPPQSSPLFLILTLQLLSQPSTQDLATSWFVIQSRLNLRRRRISEIIPSVQASLSPPPRSTIPKPFGSQSLHLRSTATTLSP